MIKKIISWIAKMNFFENRLCSDDFLFDTRDEVRCKVVRSLLANHISYCLKDDNVSMLKSLTNENPDIGKLIDIIRQVQATLKNVITFNECQEPIGIRQAARLINLVDIYTRFNSVKEDTARSNTVLESLNSRIVDGIRHFRIKNEHDFNTAVALLSKNHWLTEHLALVILGICTVSKITENSFSIELVSKGKKLALERVMFASAFEAMSLESDRAIFFNAVRVLHSGEVSSLDEYNFYISKILAAIVKNWGTGLNGSVSSSIEYLIDFIAICVECYGKNAPVPRRGMSKSYRDVYEIIYKHQKGLPVENRLFDIVDNKLAPGYVDLMRGMISISEEIALKVIGKKWNTKENLSDLQEDYVKKRLARNGNLYVIDLEIKIDNISENVKVELGVSTFDIDFLVRDNVAKKIYAIQLKHLQSVHTSGLLYWMSYLANYEKKLSKAISQLTYCRSVLRTDVNLRNRIVDSAKPHNIHIEDNELDNVIPIVLHNIGTIDFWKMQEGVILYDLNTFCNIFEGRLAVIKKIEKECLPTESFVNKVSEHCQPCEPDRVIAAYKNDPDFKSLSDFDLLRRVDRKIEHENFEFVAKGIGI